MAEVASSLLIGTAFGLICMVMAERRGRDKWLGSAFGLLFGILTVIVYWIIGDSSKKRLEKSIARSKEREEREQDII